MSITVEGDPIIRVELDPFDLAKVWVTDEEPNLPDVPSALIRLALDDLEAVERDDKYAVNLNLWHYPNVETGICMVCLAGAVMAKTIGLWPSHDVGPRAFVNRKDIEAKLRALDWFRMGSIEGGLTSMGLDVPEDCLKPECIIPEYKANPALFKAAMRAMATDLENVGL